MQLRNRILGGYNPSYKWINPTNIPFITGVITHLLSGMSHQVDNDRQISQDDRILRCWHGITELFTKMVPHRLYEFDGMGLQK